MHISCRSRLSNPHSLPLSYFFSFSPKYLSSHSLGLTPFIFLDSRYPAPISDFVVQISPYRPNLRAYLHAFASFPEACAGSPPSPFPFPSAPSLGARGVPPANFNPTGSADPRSQMEGGNAAIYLSEVRDRNTPLGRFRREREGKGGDVAVVCGARARRVGRSLESTNLRKVCLSAVEKYVKSQAMCHHRFLEGNERRNEGRNRGAFRENNRRYQYKNPVRSPIRIRSFFTGFSYPFESESEYDGSRIEF